MAIDPFGKLLAVEQAIAQDQFQRRKYQDLIDRQNQADALAAQEREMQLNAFKPIQDALAAQESEFLQYGPQPQEFTPDYGQAIQGALSTNLNPYTLDAASNLTSLLKPASGFNPKATKPILMEDADGNNVLAFPTISEDGTTQLRQISTPEGYRITDMTPEERAGLKIETNKQQKFDEADIKLADEVYASAKTAKDQIRKLNETEAALQSEDAITGVGSEYQLGLNRILAKIGNEKAKGKAITTQYLQTLLGSEVFPLIKSLGIGARGLDTPAEREFLLSVMTGDIPMEKETLMRMLQFRKQAAQRAIQEYQTYENRGLYDDSRRPKLDFNDINPTTTSTGGWSIKRK